MTVGRNNEFSLGRFVLALGVGENLLADGALPIGLLTGLGAGCGDFLDLGQLVTVGGNNQLSLGRLVFALGVAENLLADGALPIGFLAGLGAGCGDFLDLGQLMTLGLNDEFSLSRLVFALRIAKQFLAHGALPMLLDARLIAGRGLSSDLVELVAASRNHKLGFGRFILALGVGENLLANFALPVGFLTGLGAGCGNLLDLGQRMPLGRNGKRFKACLVLTLGIAKELVAVQALPIGLCAGGRAACGNLCDALKVVALGRDHASVLGRLILALRICKELLADGALPCFLFARFGAGRGRSLKLIEVVTRCRNDQCIGGRLVLALGIQEQLAAHFAAPISLLARLRAGRRFFGVRDKRMAVGAGT